MTTNAILVLNSGSSSLKFGVYSATAEPRATYRGEIEGIGGGQGKIWLKDSEGKSLEQGSRNFPQQSDAAKAVSESLTKLKLAKLEGIGHRVVHGGPQLTTHQRITPQVLNTLEGAAHFAPLHVPAAIALIRETKNLYPGVPQFACFDTAFHATMPATASRLPVPRKYWDSGIRKYGFHGLSCESIVHQLRNRLPKYLIVAHLGNGASITAIVDGKSVDTTMGLTPTGGIVMGTRPGDLDPGVLLHILNTNGNNVDELARTLDKESGLLGISGTASDMRKLHEAAGKGDAQAQLAIEMFARAAAKAIGGFVATMGELDTLVFTGGIGEHDAEVRARICAGMKIFGLRLDQDENNKNAREIGRVEGAISVQVIETDEDGQIARHVAALLEKSDATQW